MVRVITAMSVLSRSVLQEYLLSSHEEPSANDSHFNPPTTSVRTQLGRWLEVHVSGQRRLRPRDWLREQSCERDRCSSRAFGAPAFQWDDFEMFQDQCIDLWIGF